MLLHCRTGQKYGRQNVAQNESNFSFFTSSDLYLKWRNGGIIFPLFDGFTYNTSGHFAHCSYNIRAYYMLNHQIRCIYTKDFRSEHGHYPLRKDNMSSSSNNKPVRIVLPFKDQASADFLRTQLKDLSMKTNTTIQPVFISHSHCFLLF